MLLLFVGDCFWIGATNPNYKTKDKDTFRWLNGKLLRDGYHKWSSSEPHGEQYLLYCSSDETFRDWSSEHRLYALCETPCS